ncbi:hypothetical protein PSHT_14668, partial [Puccinia striiformis]
NTKPTPLPTLAKITNNQEEEGSSGLSEVKLSGSNTKNQKKKNEEIVKPVKKLDKKIGTKIFQDQQECSQSIQQFVLNRGYLITIRNSCPTNTFYRCSRGGSASQNTRTENQKAQQLPNSLVKNCNQSIQIAKSLQLEFMNLENKSKTKKLQKLLLSNSSLNHLQTPVFSMKPNTTKMVISIVFYSIILFLLNSS